jgi:hypothetical protein
MNSSVKAEVGAGVTRLAWWEARQASLWGLVNQAKRREYCTLERDLARVMMGYLKDVVRWMPCVTLYVAEEGDESERRALARVEAVRSEELRERFLVVSRRGTEDVFIWRGVVKELLELRRSVQRLCQCLERKWAKEDQGQVSRR